MIRIEKNTLQQEVWFPRTERGENTFRKTYQDGIRDGYQDGLASQKVKLYDGMRLAYSTIKSLDDFDFSDVTNYERMFANASFPKGVYDFDLRGVYHYGVFINTNFNDSEKVTVTVSEINYFQDAQVENVKNFYYIATEPITRTGYGALYSFGKIENYYFYGDTSQCTRFYNFIALYDCKNLYLNVFDMSSQTDTNTELIKGNKYENIYIDDKSPRLTLERLTSDYSKRRTNPKTVFHYGKERWTYDTEKKEWVLSGYDD